MNPALALWKLSHSNAVDLQLLSVRTSPLASMGVTLHLQNLPSSGVKLLAFRASPTFSSCSHFTYHSCFSCRYKPCAFCPTAGPLPALPSKTDHPAPPGSVTREEAARLSRSRMGREEGTEMLSGTQRQSCSWNRKELQLGPDCSARQGQRRPESWHCTYLLSHVVSPAWHRPALSHVDLPSVKLWENSDQVINFIRVGRQEWNLISLCNG